MNLHEKVKILIDNGLLDRKDLFLIDFSVSTDNSIRIIIDGDNGVSIEDCIALSRAVEHNLDREEQDFSIEVTSFGALKPFSLKRQYKKNIGREVEISLLNGEKAEGVLKNVYDEEVILEITERIPKSIGKGKITITRELKLPFANCKEAKVIIKF